MMLVTLLSFFVPLLAHEEAEALSFGELFTSIGLLVLSVGIAAALFIAIFLKPILRVRRQWKEGKLSGFKKSIYLVTPALIALTFLIVVWKFGWAAYYDFHYRKYEEAHHQSGEIEPKGVEYQWDRWHIIGNYHGTNGFVLFVDDILGKSKPNNKLTASVRIVDPIKGEWQPMKWDEKKKAFLTNIPPQGDKMEFEFRLKSGWRSFNEFIIGYTPRPLAIPKKSDVVPLQNIPGLEKPKETIQHSH